MGCDGQLGLRDITSDSTVGWDGQLELRGRCMGHPIMSECTVEIEDIPCSRITSDSTVGWDRISDCKVGVLVGVGCS